jgi:hypothetical protein
VVCTLEGFEAVRSAFGCRGEGREPNPWPCDEGVVRCTSVGRLLRWAAPFEVLREVTPCIVDTVKGPEDWWSWSQEFKGYTEGEASYNRTNVVMRGQRVVRCPINRCPGALECAARPIGLEAGAGRVEAAVA